MPASTAAGEHNPKLVSHTCDRMWPDRRDGRLHGSAAPALAAVSHRNQGCAEHDFEDHRRRLKTDNDNLWGSPEKVDKVSLLRGWF